ncbi:hypothetical protein P3S67_016102 [Capsicum chacoense]
MSKSSISKSLFVILFIVLLFSVEEIGVEAKECQEKLTHNHCDYSKADLVCLHDCQYRHGQSVKTSCSKYCICTWECN